MNDYTQADRMRRYRARLALVRATKWALEQGNYPHVIRRIVDAILEDRNADLRYGNRPRYDKRTLLQKTQDGDF